MSVGVEPGIRGIIQEAVQRLLTVPKKRTMVCKKALAVILEISQFRRRLCQPSVGIAAQHLTEVVALIARQKTMNILMMKNIVSTADHRPMAQVALIAQQGSMSTAQAITNVFTAALLRPVLVALITHRRFTRDRTIVR